MRQLTEKERLVDMTTVNASGKHHKTDKLPQKITDQLTDTENEQLKVLTNYVYDRLNNDPSGHDWWHIYRVVCLANQIVSQENGDRFIVLLAALVHDVIDDKLVDDPKMAEKALEEELSRVGLSEKQVSAIMAIITNMSYRKSLDHKDHSLSIEGQIVQDADRLDANGAMGVVRTMIYGGHKGHILYDPSKPPRDTMTLEEYKHGSVTTINHLYEKIIHLKDLMNTKTGKKLAEGRHQYLLDFLEEFHAEWDGLR